jgi:hypothetical protein
LPPEALRLGVPELISFCLGGHLVKFSPAASLCLLLTCSVSFAQKPAAKPTVAGQYTLREGEDVNLRFSQPLSSKTAAEGDQVTFELVDDIKVGDVVVVKAGSKAQGEVSSVKKAGMMGKAGDMSIRLNYLRAGDAKIHLRGSKGKEGENKTTSTVVLTVLFGPIGLIKHGKDVEIPVGQSFHAFVSDDVVLPPVTSN